MLKVAIIGCGVIAPTHAKALALDGRAEVAWACDLDLATAKSRVPAKRHGTDYREALADPAVDLVCICTPHADHAAPLAAAVAAGKHVICEKPLGVTPAQVHEMVASSRAGEAKGLVMSGIFQHRYNPLVRRVRELVRNGDFGAISAASMDFRCTRTQQYYASGAWRGTWAKEGGALLINQAIHTIDLLNWIMGDPVRVAGRVEQRRMGGIIACEDWAEFTVGYAGGGSATFSAVNDGTSSWHTDVRLVGERGSVTLGYGLKAISHPSRILRGELEALDRHKDEIVKLDGAGKTEYGDYHALQIADAISAIETGRKPMVTIADAASSVHTVLGVYDSSAAGGIERRLPLNAYQHPNLTSATLAQGK